MQLSSPAFEDEGLIPSVYTCDGKDIHPPFAFDDVPPAAVSLAIFVEDPDAPMNWIHWIMWNIDPTLTGLEKGEFPEGATEGMTSFGRAGWGGPCPPDAEHHYRFHLYALDTMLDIPSTSGMEDFLNAIDGHILEEAQLIGVYQRKTLV